METETIKLTSTQIDILIKGYYLKEKGTSVIVKHDVTGSEPLIGESEIPVTVDFRVKILGTDMEKPVSAEVFKKIIESACEQVEFEAQGLQFTGNNRDFLLTVTGKKKEDIKRI